MGSFYATCSISDLSLTGGDPTYLQLLVPTYTMFDVYHGSEGKKMGLGEKGLRVSNDGAIAEFIPFGFPILGEYYDYGDINNIVRDRNVEMLEEFFGMSIEDIFRCATDDRWYRHGYKPVVLDKTKEEYKGQHASWTIADNKMKNIEVLKKLTVTYFRKEHYDFLSEKLRGDDSYWMGECEKRIAKYKKNLELAAKVRKPPIQLTIADITDEQVQEYRDIFVEEGDDISDEKIKEKVFVMETIRRGGRLKWMDKGLDRAFYIPDISDNNMFKLLPLTGEDHEEVAKQYRFIVNMHSLYKTIRPSHYGSQEDNFALYAEFHKFSTELVSKIDAEKKNEYVLDEIAYILKYELKGIDKDVVKQVREEIVGSLKENGYEIEI